MSVRLLICTLCVFKAMHACSLSCTRSHYVTMQVLHKEGATVEGVCIEINRQEELPGQPSWLLIELMPKGVIFSFLPSNRLVALQVSQRGAEAAQRLQERCGRGCGSPEGGRGRVQGEHQPP